MTALPTERPAGPTPTEPDCRCSHAADDHVFTAGGFCNLCDCDHYTPAERAADARPVADDVRLSDDERATLLNGPAEGGEPIKSGETGRDRLARAAAIIVAARLAVLAESEQAHRPVQIEGMDVVQRIVNAWDCCGTCAGGVLAAHTAQAVREALGAVAARLMQQDTGDEGEHAECYENAARIARDSQRPETS